MKLGNKKKIVAGIFGVSPKRVRLEPTRLEEIKDAITKVDFRQLVKQGAMQILPIRGAPRHGARFLRLQKIKGRRKGHGSRKGARTARLPRKLSWISKIRSQRKMLKSLAEKKVLDKPTFRLLYLKAKGGFFRSTRHMQLYIEERKLAKK